jgi:GntR family transcriptional regulator
MNPRNAQSSASPLRKWRRPGRHPPHRGGAAPLYTQLAGVFRRRIESGTWPLGGQIPTLEQLIAESGASRVTVRQALTLLEQNGLLERYRGRGTFVVGRPERNMWCELETDWGALVRAHEGIATDLLKCEPAERPPVPSHALGTTAVAYQFIQRRHRRGGVPYLIGFAHLDADVWAQLSLERIRDLPLIKVLAELPDVAIGRAEQTMQVTTADFEIADLLEIHVDAPVVVVDRSVFGAHGRLLLETRGYYRAEFVKLTVKLK